MTDTLADIFLDVLVVWFRGSRNTGMGDESVCDVEVWVAAFGSRVVFVFEIASLLV